MSVLSFRHRAIASLRDHLHVHTSITPENRIEDADGNAGFDAELVEGRTAGLLATIGAWGLVLAAVIELAGDRPMREGAHTALDVLALVLGIASAIVLVAAWISRRRHTRAVRIELRGPGVVKRATLEDLASGREPGTVWIAAELGFTEEALAAARRLEVRCFVADGTRLREHVASASASASASAA